jgi:gliding motility-associated-like protein
MISMRKGIILVVVAFFCQIAYTQTGMWTWIKGSDTLNDPGVSGTMGVPDVANNPEGRYQAAHWIDYDGNLWIFGGVNVPTSQLRNDLWRYNPNTNIWTWMKGALTLDEPGVYGTQGIPSLNNNPGARGYGSTAWTDQQGRLWLRGGIGYAATGSKVALDDMWMYDIQTNQWTWMKGSNTGNVIPNYGTLQVESATTTPGGMQENSTAWVKSDGTLWTFGGRSTNSLHSADMWKFDITTNNWTWMKGSAGLDTNGNYGNINVESSTNLPPARCSYTSWQDKQDNFYIFGGIANLGLHNDTWRFNTTTNNWTWISGSNQTNHPGNYTQECSPSVNAFPSARFENRSAKTLGCPGNFWTFGGFDNSEDPFNDFWNFNASTNQWTWISGDTSTFSPGNYGVLNVPSPLNDPPARGGACLWELPDGEIRLWGGLSIINSVSNMFNDMWSYVPDTACAGKLANPSKSDATASICRGDTFYYNGQPYSQPGVYNFYFSGFNSCDSLVRLNIEVIELPLTDTSFSICRGDTLYYDGLPYSQSGVYTFSFPRLNKCDSLVRLNIEVLENPIAGISIIPVGDTLTVGNISVTDNSSKADSTFLYLNNILVNINDSLPLLQAGDYCLQLVAKSKEGCLDTAKQCFYVINNAINGASFAIPKAFTPDGNGANDVFYPAHYNSSKGEIKTFHVYNRWGELIYSNPAKGWDGTYKGEPQPAGTYMYSFVFLIPDAQSPSGTKEIKKIGSFSLLR